jgi:hypothetical protein
MLVLGQNVKYDQDKIARLGFTIRSLASDTMLKASAINPELPKRLALIRLYLQKYAFTKTRECTKVGYTICLWDVPEMRALRKK